ncbi:related to RPB9 DNA-directed RNA polymerase II, 14.2 KD subunit [Ramularia collo-cygni]|uniref:DNA-directed RNA polymerase subunit n=1 Tax=Ramularia collo-cygni TaxID=112498 RepID=A0A2D3UPI6_9PEZI|nr:related to RPB9 DNA-directed RNA polymerase II, 14.2 KD subunit [Ramularia collo-cygni]CZT14805.1 related to RPB9 DNA-directed RNA polymerase II, 14.2 KD subunit [Ramularia collo-cygni]
MAESSTTKVTFRFCRECSNMLYPKEDREGSQLMFACRTCEYSEPATASCIWRNSLKEDIKETAGNIDDVAQDPTLPHAAVECKACHARDAVFFQSQQRTPETGMALFYVCCECGEQWSTLDEKK